jgi:hypothetical protein
MKTITKVKPFRDSFSKVDQILEITRNDDGSSTYIITRMTRNDQIDFKSEVKLIDNTDSRNPYDGFIWRGSNQNVYELNQSKKGYSTLKFYPTKAKAIGSIKKLMQSLNYRDYKMTIKLAKEDRGFFFVGFEL